MIYRIFLDTVCAILKAIRMPGIPLENETRLEELAKKFEYSREYPNTVYGCVDALDGIAVAIKKPPDEYVPRNFSCRKGLYALPLQAVVVVVPPPHRHQNPCRCPLQVILGRTQHRDENHRLNNNSGRRLHNGNRGV